ncbi:hemolysin family protein [Candidatus Formimonas warabiya]|uniref:Hemolysin n=1 Tax=Formimonas warabiya TaxID=1761012 RepID=A0A3G1KU42_FORW1|nr:hemolysin family protein [Candidatus Formimonas warabiya]ATW25971.1 hemolysin [Candidatus Formimonas warabiya]
MFSELVILAMLILLNGFFAASEIALISLSENKIKKMGDKGNKRALLLQKFLGEPSRFLATIQIGITLAGFLASAFASESFADKLVQFIKTTGLPVHDSLLKAVSVTFITVILSYFTLVFGELVPKRFGMQKSEEISLFAVGPLTFLSRITGPFVAFLTHSTNFFIRLMGGNPQADEERITEEEIRMMVDVGQEKGVIQSTEKEMINNIFEFDNTDVSEIMTHRTDVVGVPVNAGFEEVLKIMIRDKFTRIPVYEETIDNIVGILHVKDFLQFIYQDQKEHFKLENILRKPYFVPESKKTDDLFTEMQKNHIQMAVVIDEYGGTAGIVTVEDLLEEIVGNIFDEHDVEERDVERIDKTTYLFAGNTSLDKVKESLEIELPVDEYDTLNGFILGQLGRIPDDEEKPVVEYTDVTFKVEEIEEKRIVKVKAVRGTGLTA